MAIECSHSIGLVQGLSALKRREQFVTNAEQLLTENPDLLQLIKQCLHNLPKERPLTRKIVESLSRMAAVGRYNPYDYHYPFPLIFSLYLSLSLQPGQPFLLMVRRGKEWRETLPVEPVEKLQVL